MKNKMDKLKSKIKTNKKFTVFLFVFMLVGVATGTLFITMLSSSDKNLVKNYLEQYIKTIESGKITYVSILWNTFLNGGVVAVAIWLLGVSIVGIPVILFLFFCKAFTLGFSIGSFLYVYKWKGSLLALSYVFPHQILTLIAFGILMMYALSVSLKMIEAVMKKKTIDFKSIMGKYSVVLGVSMILLLVSALYETFALPNIMKILLPIIK